jgi:hypothetical protein
MTPSQELSRVEVGVLLFAPQFELRDLLFRQGRGLGLDSGLVGVDFGAGDLCLFAEKRRDGKQRVRLAEDLESFGEHVDLGGRRLE